MSHDPPKWGIFDTHGPYIDGHKFGLLVSTAHVNRFKARYRAAHAITRVELDGFHPDTESGYTALTQTFLTYSSFEYFLQAIKIKQKRTASLLAKYPVVDWVREIRAADAGNLFYTFIISQVDARHRHHLSEYLAGRDFNYTFLASSVRHTFAHGMLTPSAGGCPPGQAAAVCSLLTASLISIMDHEFSDRMDALERAASTT